MSHDKLLSEVNFFHSRIFGFLPSQDIQNDYIAAHKVYGQYIQEHQQQKIDQLVFAQLDIISLEFYLRLKEKKNLLTQKFLILFYLTEVRPEYQSIFTSWKSDRFAVLKLGYYTLKSFFYFLKGAIMNVRLKVL